MQYKQPRLARIKSIGKNVPSASPLNIACNTLPYVFARMGLPPQISKSLPHQENIWDLYHWRDRSGREIDIIAICPPTKLIGVEIKASASVSNEDFKHLKWFATDGPGRNREMTGIVIYLGGEAVSFGPCMVALPLQSLWANWIL